MGLDWHAQVKSGRKDREDYIRKYYSENLNDGEDMEDLIERCAPTHKSPCEKVGAKKVREIPGHINIIREILEERIAEAKSAAAEGRRTGYVEYFLSKTPDEIIEEEMDKYVCDHCPLLAALNDANSQDSFFLGVTVSSCDFRGKMISADDEIWEPLAEEAYEEHDVEDMLEYADRLEVEIERLRKNGCLEKDSYEDYVAEMKRCQEDFGSTPFANNYSEIMSKEEYEATPHWRERNIRRAIHWLRTCSEFGVEMLTSY